MNSASSAASSPDSDFTFEPDLSLPDIASISGASADGVRPPGPRYSELEPYRYRSSFSDCIALVYYRLYAEDGAMPSANPVYIDDPYLGRIPAELVAPPRTAKDVKLCLSGVEAIGDHIATKLFISASNPKPIADGHCVPISKYPGPGCVPNEPMALVAMCTGEGNRSLGEVPAEADHRPSDEGPTPFEAQYRKRLERSFRFLIGSNKLP